MLVASAIVPRPWAVSAPADSWKADGVCIGIPRGLCRHIDRTQTRQLRQLAKNTILTFGDGDGSARDIGLDTGRDAVVIATPGPRHAYVGGHIVQ